MILWMRLKRVEEDINRERPLLRTKTEALYKMPEWFKRLREAYARRHRIET